jgi:hypothetical protein
VESQKEHKKFRQRKKHWKRQWVECIWKMSSSLVHLSFGGHVQRPLSEMHCGYFTSVWIAEESLSLQCIWWACGLHVLYSHVEFSLSRICWKQYVNAALLYFQGLSASYKLQGNIYIKISLDFKEQSLFICLYQGTVNICERFCIYFQNAAYT